MPRFVPLLSLLCACGAPRAAAPPVPAPVEDPAGPAVRVPAQPTPWTDAFMDKAILVADRIRIEGPTGLFEHAVSRADDALYERRVVTTAEGMRQTVRPRADSPGVDPVRAQLDAWQLAALRELVLLERLDPAAPVIVTASGEAVWRDTDGHERREPTLVFRGEVERAGAAGR